jgi:hydroxymethylglutaryl-CoA synthase
MDRLTIGITNYSVYVPRRRMRREAITAAWGAPSAPGCKAVLNFDEDSLTMAQSAAWPLAQSGGAEALSFASTTAPYWQRSTASLIAARVRFTRANGDRGFRRITPRGNHRIARRA